MEDKDYVNLNGYCMIRKYCFSRSEKYSWDECDILSLSNVQTIIQLHFRVAYCHNTKNFYQSYVNVL